MDIDSPASTDFANEFNAASSIPASERPPTCNTLLETIHSQSTPTRLPDNLVAYVIFILDGEILIAGVKKPSEPLSLISSRPLLTTFITRLSTLSSPDTRIAVSERGLSLIAPRSVSFEEQETALKNVLADAHQANEDYTAAASVLSSINLTTSSRGTIPDQEKASVWIRIARCHLEEGSSVAAASFINRAKQVLHNVNDTTLRLHFHASHARILDSQRNFLDAAQVYHTLSYETSVDEDDRLRSLSAAITCAVLAGAGPQRSRTLAKLYKDDRSAQTSEFGILESVFLDRMVTAEEVSAFAGKLEEHQRAATADGSTVVERAMLEHNLLGASRMYLNIGLEELGELLGVSAARAEGYAAGMIGQRRLAGHVDQIEQRIFFEGFAGGASGGGESKDIGGNELKRWDANVQGLAEEVEKVTTMIQTQYSVGFFDGHVCFQTSFCYSTWGGKANV